MKRTFQFLNFFLFSIFKLKKNDYNGEPLIGFEPMTYALPWCYSTAELKGPIHLTLTTSQDRASIVHFASFPISFQFSKSL